MQIYRITVIGPILLLSALAASPIFAPVAEASSPLQNGVLRASLLPHLSSFPQTAFTPLERGKEACRRGDYAGGAKELEAAVRAEPERGEALNWYGYALLMQGKTNDALPYLKKAAQSDGGADAWANLGSAYLRTAQYKKGTAAYKKATALRPTEGAFWMGLGVSYQQAGDAAAAADALRRAATLLPQDAAVWAALGSVEAKRGQIPAAISALEAARKLQPDNDALLMQLGGIDAEAGRWAAAADAYGAAAALRETKPGVKPEATPRYNQGVALMKAGKFEASLGAFDAALLADPKHYDALVNSGYLLYKQGKADDALTRFTKAAAIKPDTTLAWTNLASVYDSKGDTVNAAAAWRKAAGLQPGDYAARVSLADCLTRLGQYDALIAVGKEMGAIRPNAAEPYNRIGLAYLTQSDSIVDPAAKRRKQEKALEAFREAVRREPDSAAAHNNLGVAFERLGMTASAAASYRRALAADVSFADAKQNLARLDKLTADKPDASLSDPGKSNKASKSRKAKRSGGAAKGKGGKR